MDLNELLNTRYSCRFFKPDMPSHALMRDIAEAALRAPSAHNNQPYRLFLIRSDAKKNAVKEATGCHFNAPALFLICTKADEAWTRRQDGYHAEETDGAILATYLELLIQNAGMRCCYVGAFDPVKTREIFQLPDDLEPLLYLPFGYAADDARPGPRHTKRRPVEDLLTEC